MNLIQTLSLKISLGNTGIYLGNVSKYNSNKGHVTLSLNDTVELGDSIIFENENTKYTISELMLGNTNIKNANIHQKVTVGRMKGNIKVGDKIFKIKSKSLSLNALDSFSSENLKQGLKAILDVHLNQPISLEISDEFENKVVITSEDIPVEALKLPVTKDKLETQINKLGNYPFYFKNLKINLDENIFIPHFSTINELRRTALDKYCNLIINKYKRKLLNIPNFEYLENKICEKNHKIALLLNNLDLKLNYSSLDNVDKLYIPLKYFYLKGFSNILNFLTTNFNVYIYLPTIFKSNFVSLFENTINNATNNYKICGFVVPNIGYFDMLKKYKGNYELIADFHLNIFNNETTKNLHVNSITISPELNKDEINNISLNCNLPCEFIVYGNLPLMTTSYCLLGKTNRCYPTCSQKCKTENTYYLKDRMNFLFKVVPDNLQTITTLYNSKITSILPSEIANVDIYRIDVLNEDIQTINEIISAVKSNKRLEGINFTNGNLNRSV